MDHNIKQEKINDEPMDIGSDFNNIQAPDFMTFDSDEAFQADDSKTKLRDGFHMVDTQNGAGDKPNFSVFSMVASTAPSQASQVRMVYSIANNTQGSEQVSLRNNQIVLKSATGQTQLVQAVPKKVVTPDGQKVVTKLIIAPKNATSGQQHFLSVGPQGLQPIQNSTVNTANHGLIGQPSLATSLHLPSSPMKTYMLTQSPQQVATPTTPTKYSISSASVPMSPAKTPPKVTMIPVSALNKSPQKGGAGQHLVMLTRPGSSTQGTSLTNTITRSPSKMVIKSAPSLTNLGQHQQFIVSQGSGGRASSSNSVSLANVPSNVQPLSVSGSKFQYVRLVTTPTSQSTAHQVSRPAPHSIAPAPQRSFNPLGNQAPIKLTMPLSGPNAGVQLLQPKHPPNPPQQRVILPATQSLPIGGTLIRPAAGNAMILSSNSNTNQGNQPINLQGLQGFALIPAQYIPQQQLPPQSAPNQMKENFHQGPILTSKHSSSNGRTSTSEPPGQRPRKPCNCTKSQCLKLYCDCFANGEFCSNCNCNNCFNNLDHEEERQRAIKTCLERNPHAFHPKIGKGRGVSGDRRHNKGCNCKRSGCLKNYCECYEAKIMCSNLCKCVGCKNFEESPDRKTLMHLADAAEVRHQQQTAVKTKLSSQIQDLPERPHAPTTGERLPYTFVTLDVAEATCACLIAQAEEAERTRQQEMIEERMILQEFGRCLMQVIQSATKTKAPSPVP